VTSSAEDGAGRLHDPRELATGPGEAAFYFDLFNPAAYLAAEQVLATVPGPCPWVPVLARSLPGAESFEAYRCETEMLAARESIELRASALGLQPIVWPAQFPFDSELAMLAATYAKQIGKVVAFALAAFRQAFAGGNSLSVEENVLIAGAACEIHPRAIVKAIGTRSVREELERATAQAAALGVSDVPALRIGDRVLVGEALIEDALASAGPGGRRESGAA
jgi:2-hydroxychromene-2-carboxylate isomerase